MIHTIYDIIIYTVSKLKVGLLFHVTNTHTKGNPGHLAILCDGPRCSVVVNKIKKHLFGPTQSNIGTHFDESKGEYIIPFYRLDT